MIGAGDIDYMDPGAAYYQPTFTVANAVYRGLFDLGSRRPRGADA